MFELKLLTLAAVPKALDRAERYRFLNEPGEAESICLDVLQVQPDDQRALVTLLLALTDQFEGPSVDIRRSQEVLVRLHGEYERAYYGGIICERRANAVLRHGGPHSRFMAYDLFQEALRRYQKAEAIRPPENDDAILRWNTCVRILASHPELENAPDERVELPLE